MDPKIVEALMCRQNWIRQNIKDHIIASITSCKLVVFEVVFVNNSYFIYDNC